MMDFPIHIDTISMGLPIVYFKGSQVEFSILWCIFVPEDHFNLASSAEADEICQSTHLGVSSI